MPYANAQDKRAWEYEHRTERLARRRELRQAEAARQEAEGAPRSPQDLSGGGLLAALAAGSALAAYNPKLAIGAGGLTLAAAALYKKDWNWWLVGILLVILGMFFHWNKMAKTE
jgi:hypothetical protein